MHVLKFLAVIWSLLCLAGAFLPFVDTVDRILLSARDPMAVAMAGKNLEFCFVAWVLGLLALAALKVIFAVDRTEAAGNA